MRPLIQLKIPPHLCSPGDLCFAKERLTNEECFEEMCVNEILPKPFHNKLSTIPLKHATHYLAVTTHYLLRKKMFDSKISQAAITKEFMVAEKKLHLAVSSRKYDPGKKFLKQKPNPKMKKAAKTDEPKTDEVVKIPEDKQPSPEDLGEPQSNDTDDDDDEDSLPDLCKLLLCKWLFVGFLILSCPKCALVWGNCHERLRVVIFVRVLCSSEVISITPYK